MFLELCSGMLRNYLIAALRQFRMAPLYSVTNLLGLTVGSAAAILVFLFVRHELSYDRFHEQGNETYLLYWSSNFGNVSRAPVGTGPRMQAHIPEIEETLSVYRETNAYVALDNDLVQQGDVYLADPNFFTLLTYPLRSGNPRQVLAEPNSVVLTPETAEKYFGSADPIGESMVYRGSTVLTVTGIADPPPSNTHLPFKMVISLSTFVSEDTSPWTYQGYNYVRLVAGADLTSIEDRMNALEPIEAVGWAISGTTFGLFPIDRIHADAAFFVFSDSNLGSMLVIFSVIGVFLLLLASLNYVNLAVARAMQRGSEISMRRALGASRWQLGTQFLGEAAVVTGLSVLAGIVLAEVALPWFRAALNVGLDFRMTGPAGMGVPLLGLWVVLSLGAGVYPAVFMARRASAIRTGRRQSNPLLRRSLVVVQFAISIVLVAGTLLVGRQMSYIEHLDVGYERERLVGIRLQGHVADDAGVFRDRVAGVAGVASSSAAYGMPNEIMATMSQEDEGIPVQIHHLWVEAGYLDTVGLTLLEGRDFSGSPAVDTVSVIVNETAVRHFDLGDNPIGQETNGKTVIGVVKDFNTQSAHQPISPVLLMVDSPGTRGARSVVLRVSPGAKERVVEEVAAIWKGMEPGIPFTAIDAASSWMGQYQAESRLQSLTRIFSLLALFIASVGLFGLVSSTAEQRTKEIGIRKVLGASAFNLVALLAREFAGLLVIALVLAGPVAWWFGRDWLSAFAYQFDFGPGLVVIAAAGAGILALATVGIRAYIAASVNPVESLRSE